MAMRSAERGARVRQQRFHRSNNRGVRAVQQLCVCVQLPQRSLVGAACAAVVAVAAAPVQAVADAPAPIQSLQQLEETTEQQAERELSSVKERTEQSEEFARLESLLKELEEQKAQKEEEARQEAFRSNRLCRTPFGVDVVGLTETVALVGAIVGGWSARRRRKEVERVNEKLRSINTSLRQQARAGALYAPGLNYAPSLKYAPSVPPASRNRLTTENAIDGEDEDVGENGEENTGAQSRSASTVSATASATTRAAAPQLDEEMSETRAVLKQARRLLKEGYPSKALVLFNKALVQTRQSGSKLLERRAMRGLAACKRDLDDLRDSIAYLKEVLRLSQEMGEYTGDADARGQIADLLTELGDLENAGIWYDAYLQDLV